MHHSEFEGQPGPVGSSADLLRAVRMSGDARERAVAQMRSSEAMVDLVLRVLENIRSKWIGARSRRFGARVEKDRSPALVQGTRERTDDLLTSVANHR